MSESPIELKTAQDEAAPFMILQQGSRNYKVDTDEHRITFLDQRFYFTPKGEPVPSVTTILDCYPKGPEFFKWLKENGEDADDIRDEAGDNGSKLHNLTERFDKGEVITLLNFAGEIGFPLIVWTMFERYVQFRNLCHFLVPEEIETTFVSTVFGFGGTKDRVFRLPNGKRLLLDIKTSNSLHDHYWCQMAAYREAWHQELLDADPSGKLYKDGFIDDVAILWVKAKTRTDKMEMAPDKIGNCQGKGWQLVTRGAASMPVDWEIFKTVHKMWLILNGEQKPRMTSYQLSHEFVPPAIAEAKSLKKAEEGTSPSERRKTANK